MSLNFSENFGRLELTTYNLIIIYDPVTWSLENKSESLSSLWDVNFCHVTEGSVRP